MYVYVYTLALWLIWACFIVGAHCDQDAGLFGQGHISLLVASFFKQLGIGGSFVNMEHSSGTILMPHTVKECCTLALFPGST